MSWDVLLLNAPAALHQLPEDFDESTLPRLGALHAVRGIIQQLFPAVDFTDPHWGDLEATDYTIEFNIGEDDPVTSVLLHIRGEDGALSVVQALCGRAGWRAFGPDGTALDFAADPARGLREWRAFRDKGIAEARAQGKSVLISPRINGVRFDTLVQAPSSVTARPWWRFWGRSGGAA